MWIKSPQGTKIKVNVFTLIVLRLIVFACQVACSLAHEVPVCINSRKVITLNEGIEGEEISSTIAS